jgi:hypothetical protein
MLVQYQYGIVRYWYWHYIVPIPVLVFLHLGSAPIGTVHYWYWHSKMVPIPILAFLNFGSVPVWAHTITGTGIQKWFQYRCWIFCTLVHYQYWHGSLLVMAINGAHSSIGILALWFSTSMGTLHYRYWHLILPVPVMAFLHFGSVMV